MQTNISIATRDCLYRGLCLSDKILYYILSLFIIGNYLLRVESFVMADMLLQIAAIFSMGIIFLLRIRHFYVLTKYNLSILLIFGYLSVVAIQNGNFYRSLILIPLMLIAFQLLYGRQMRINPGECFKIIADIFLLFFLLNTFLMVFVPDFFPAESSVSKSYLISTNYNQFGGAIIPGLLAGCGAMSFDKTYMRNFALMLSVSIFMVAYAGSMTSTIALILIALYYLFAKNNRTLSRIAFVGIALVIVFIFFDFVLQFSKLFPTGGLTEKFFTLVGKDATFSGRTTIWTYTILNIVQSPVVGVGWYDAEWAEVNIIGVNPHNIILNLLLQGGIILLIIVITTVSILLKSTARIKTKESRLSLFIFLCYLLMMQFEVYNYFMIGLSLLILNFANNASIYGKDVHIFHNHSSL